MLVKTRLVKLVERANKGKIEDLVLEARRKHGQTSTAAESLGVSANTFIAWERGLAAKGASDDA